MSKQKGGSAKTKSHSFQFWFSCIFMLLVVGAVIFQQAPTIMLSLYVIMSLVTFAFYYKDKKAAQNGAWRTPEKTLHILALCCGWPGALLAQSRLRHKSQKKSFIVVLWASIILNCMLFMWTFTPNGAQFVSDIFAAVLGLFS